MFDAVTSDISEFRLDSASFLAMIKQGASRLGASRAVINELNVFPIPDGDTGDNMYMTICSGCSSASEGGSLSQVASSLAKGMLLGARGNSGVILSRIFSGISKGLQGLESADAFQFASALQKGVEESYKAVSIPVEGTMLTVWREGVAKAATKAGIHDCISALVAEMKESLERTPDLLPVLKEAGVVDSGGAGVLCIAEGMLDSLEGRSDDGDISAPPSTASSVDFDLFGPDTELEFGYCTEFLLRLQSAKVSDPCNFDETPIREYLESAGESVVCFREGSIVKVHVHTRTPGEILNTCQKWGEYLTLKIENMTLQHNETHQKPAQEVFERKMKPFGVVAVASGEGLVNMLRENGADIVIEGGQTMNPSVESFTRAFDKVGAKTIFVFPNNSNVILTARQAADIYTSSEIVVIPSKDVGSGYVAMASIDFSCGNASEMAATASEALGSVSTGFVCRAIRDSNLGGIKTREGDFIGMCGGSIVAEAPDRLSLALELASSMGCPSHEVALLFKGADVPESEFAALSDKLQKSCPRTEIIQIDGGQPVFDYILTLC